MSMKRTYTSFTFTTFSRVTNEQYPDANYNDILATFDSSIEFNSC